MLKLAENQPLSSQRPSLALEIERAAAKLPRFFPLDSLVASNPLCGFERTEFEAALRQAAVAFGARPHLELSEYRAWVAAQKIPKTVLEDAIAEALKKSSTPDMYTVGGRHLKTIELALRTALGDYEQAGERATEWVKAALALPIKSALQQASRFEPARQSFLAWIAGQGHPERLTELDNESFSLFQDYFLNEDAIEAALPTLASAQAGADVSARSLYSVFRSRALKLPACKRLLRTDGLDVAELLPATPLAAIADALDRIAPVRAQREAYLTRHLFNVRGWAAFVQWYEKQPRAAHASANISELLAVRLTLEKLLWMEMAVRVGGLAEANVFLDTAAIDPLRSGEQAAAPDWVTRLAALTRVLNLDLSAPPSGALLGDLQGLATFFKTHDDLWLAMRFVEAQEGHYRGHLLTSLKSRSAALPAGAERGADVLPAAQWVFCIDVPSEPMRRAVEAEGGQETFGYAGFFGAAVRYVDALDNATNQCPVLLSPAFEVAEKAHDHDAEKALERARAEHLKTRVDVAQAARAATAPAFVEGLGLGAAVRLLRDCVGHFSASESASCAAGTPDIDEADALSGIRITDQLAIARGLLSTTGLGRNLSPLVVLCAHGSHTRNNPYAAALNCGACGGQHGAPNARIVARIMNRPSIRALLAEEGLHIPAETVFVAALHDTVSDEITFLPDVEAPLDSEQLDAIKRVAKNAAQRNRQARCGRLGLAPEDAGTLIKRGQDPAMTRPEWGLANNAAFIVAPRSFTAGLDLEGRTFLHSYDWQGDPEGDVLTAILTAPMVVAQWINAQYFFSSVDNAVLGSGDKVTQNVVGCGVMQGDLSDLLLGLPWQSVRNAEGALMHEPLRLQVVVRAPRSRVDGVLEAATQVAGLFDRGWIALTVFDPITGEVLRYAGRGQWSRWDAQEGGA